jgi:hypothetical protein
MASSLNRGDAVGLDVERARPGRDAHEDPGRRVLRKISGVDGIHRRELLDRGAIDVALQDLIEGGTGGLEAQLHLLHNQLRLALDGSLDDLPRLRIEGWEARHINRVAMAGDGRGQRLPALQYVEGGSTRMISRFMTALLFWRFLFAGTSRPGFNLRPTIEPVSRHYNGPGRSVRARRRSGARQHACRADERPDTDRLGTRLCVRCGAPDGEGQLSSPVSNGLSGTCSTVRQPGNISPKNGQTALRLCPGRLVLQHVPVLGELAVLDADNIGRDPGGVPAIA